MRAPRAGAIPSAAHPRRTEDTSRSNTRSAPFAGRATEATARRKARLQPNVWDFGPPPRVSTCSDVMRVRYGDRRCPGDSKPGLTAVHALAQANVPTSILDSLAPDPRGVARSPKGRPTLRRSTASYPATDRRADAPPRFDEGATRRPLFTGALAAYESGRGSALRTDDHSSFASRVEDPRARRCDLITCCVASPPRRRAIGVAQRAKAPLAGVARAVHAARSEAGLGSPCESDRDVRGGSSPSLGGKNMPASEREPTPPKRATAS